ncbi:TetR/AcrR family transcriptional regulator [Nocardia gamkensis]|uniref:TetR/AcrR family transcriptional regulator n=1 Tax=Nocardia gamkensis TaxID=352869 RepID=UPI0033FE2807
MRTDSNMRVSQRRYPVQQRSRDTFEAIVSAASQVLRDCGYGQCSTGAIAKAAGVSKSSLYQYFSDKDAIIRILVERAGAQASLVIDEHLDALFCQGRFAPDPGLQLRLLEAVDEYRDIASSLIREAPELAVNRYFMGIEQRCRDLLRAYVNSNPDLELTPAELDALLLVITTSYRAVCHEYLRNDLRSQRESIAATLFNLTVGALRGDYEPPRI